MFEMLEDQPRDGAVGSPAFWFSPELGRDWQLAADLILGDCKQLFPSAIPASDAQLEALCSLPELKESPSIFFLCCH